MNLVILNFESCNKKESKRPLNNIKNSCSRQGLNYVNCEIRVLPMLRRNQLIKFPITNNQFPNNFQIRI